jgi:hypothetical protein
LAVWPCSAERDLVEPVVRRAVQELGVLEHAAVRDCLDLPVAGLPPELHEVEEVGVHGRLAARQDQALRPALLALDDLDLDVHGPAHRPVVSVGVEAERAVVVAVVGEAHPVALLVGGLLVGAVLPALSLHERVVLEVGEAGLQIGSFEVWSQEGQVHEGCSEARRS